MSYPSSDAYPFEDFDTATDHLLLSATPSPYSEIGLEFGMTASTEQNPVQYSIGAPVDIPYQMQLFLEQDNVDFDHDPFIAQFTSSNEQKQLCALSHSDVLAGLQMSVNDESPVAPVKEEPYNYDYGFSPLKIDTVYEENYQNAEARQPPNQNTILPTYVYEDNSGSFYDQKSYTNILQRSLQSMHVNVDSHLITSSSPSPSSMSSSSSAYLQPSSMGTVLPPLDSSSSASANSTYPSTPHLSPTPTGMSIYNPAQPTSAAYSMPLPYPQPYFYGSVQSTSQYNFGYYPQMEQTTCYNASGAQADQMVKRNGTAKPAGKKRGPKPKKKKTAEEASSNDENGISFPSQTRSRVVLPEIEIYSRSELSIELAKKIVRDEKGSYICPVCFKPFNRQFVIKQHLYIHTGDKPFACGTCKKAFSDRSNLRAHIKTHNDSKSFHCNTCGKNFLLKSYLKKHENLSCPMLKIEAKSDEARKQIAEQYEHEEVEHFENNFDNLLN
ncbi:hypothetical protein WR25_01013 [Diploscapter pachys]|uniref:C2H2-type domain-containing protein n=1 Tax=Diploscapter pachys TaxID=2018661 RepID=A0A2A2KGX2_9BILA|nr:hypothetical protein WR25_01013 [Diploscapter pachys]